MERLYEFFIATLLSPNPSTLAQTSQQPAAQQTLGMDATRLRYSLHQFLWLKDSSHGHQILWLSEPLLQALTQLVGLVCSGELATNEFA